MKMMAPFDRSGGPPRAAVTIILALAVVCCGTPPRLDAVPPELEEQVTIGGMSHIRYFVDHEPDDFVQDYLASVAKEREQLRQAGHSGPLPPAAFLAISGGGENGAFGAG